MIQREWFFGDANMSLEDNPVYKFATQAECANFWLKLGAALEAVTDEFPGVAHGLQVAGLQKKVADLFRRVLAEVSPISKTIQNTPATPGATTRRATRNEIEQTRKIGFGQI